MLKDLIAEYRSRIANGEFDAFSDKETNFFLMDRLEEIQDIEIFQNAWKIEIPREDYTESDAPPPGGNVHVKWNDKDYLVIAFSFMDWDCQDTNDVNIRTNYNPTYMLGDFSWDEVKDILRKTTSFESVIEAIHKNSSRRSYRRRKREKEKLRNGNAFSDGQ
jgi:spore germination protein YaaH